MEWNDRNDTSANIPDNNFILKYRINIYLVICDGCDASMETEPVSSDMAEKRRNQCPTAAQEYT